MPKIKKLYLCDYCGQEYGTIKKARECEALGFHPTLEVGDIVKGQAGFGWYDGDKWWVVNPKVKEESKGHADGRNCFDDCCCFVFYYVVTKVDGDKGFPHDERRDLHRPRYHLFTKAMLGKSGYRSGMTFDKDHICVEKVKEPPEVVVQDSKNLLGKKATNLL